MFRKLSIALLILPAMLVMAAAEKAPEIRKSSIWINSPPLTLKALKGKVVVIDFWAFDCAPCLETMPHVIQLYDKYAARGLVVIGVHTPRTSDEKEVGNVREAVMRLGIRYPVVIDGSHKIFDDYRCDLWPTLFVIDRDGDIRYVHGGIGRYDDADQIVQKLLGGRS